MTMLVNEHEPIRRNNVKQVDEPGGPPQVMERELPYPDEITKRDLGDRERKRAHSTEGALDVCTAQRSRSCRASRRT